MGYTVAPRHFSKHRKETFKVAMIFSKLKAGWNQYNQLINQVIINDQL